MTPAPRTRLGRFAGAASRYSVFRTEAAVEIDQMDHFEVTRKRVFFDDMLLVTHHRELGTIFFIVNAFVAVIFWMIAFIFLLSAESGGVIAFACLAAPSTIALILRLILRVDVVTVYGRRSKAVLRYTFRKQFARDTFADLCERARAAQQKLADEIAASVPIATPEEVPPLPPMAFPAEIPHVTLGDEIAASTPIASLEEVSPLPSMALPAEPPQVAPHETSSLPQTETTGEEMP